jgi:hypothetical protein
LVRPQATIAAVAAVTLLAMLPASAPAASVDVASTGTFVRAYYALVRNARVHLRAAEAVPRAVLAQVRRECPHAAAGSPQGDASTQLSNEVIGAMVLTAYHLDLPALNRFVAAAGHLHWSDPRLTRTVRHYVADLRVLAKLAPPHLCADVGAWVASGYRTLPAATIAFNRVFMPAWVGIEPPPAGLGVFADDQQRGLLKRSDALIVQLAEGEARAVKTWGDIIDELGVQP